MAGLGVVFYAPADVILADDQVVQPDLLFDSKERQSILQQGGVHGAPDLVIEILSPSTASRDLILKRKLYGKYGVQEFWIVNPDAKTIEILTLIESGLEPCRRFADGSTLTSPLLPGLVIKLDEIFA
jgi:Uma2 family endonuclease